jgi:hypothetical protein
MYTMSGLMGVAAVSHALVKPLQKPEVQALEK